MQIPPFIHPPDSRLEIRTPRLLLRPTRTADASMLWPHVADHEMTRWMTWDPHRDQQETKEFLERTVRGRIKGHGFAWVLLEEGQFRGIVGIEGIMRQVLGVRMDRAELGYWIVPGHQGRGLVTEAAGAAVACGFRSLGLHKVIVRSMTPNAASIRVIEKLGFQPVGTLRREVKRRGRWQDLL